MILTSSKVVDPQLENSQNSTSIAPVSLFAQPIENGFQLVDTTPKMILKIYKTSVNNIFLGTKENFNGIVYQKNENWFFEYYLNGKLISEVFTIKF